MRVVSLVLALFLLAGCTSARPEPPRLPAGWPQAAETVVFQAFPQGGFISPADYAAQAPSLTLLADGRVIRLDRAQAEPRFVAAQVPEVRLPALYEELRTELGGLAGHHEAGTWTDDATTRFTLWHPGATQSLDVYGFSVAPQETEQEKAVLERLRKAWAAVVAAAGPEWGLYAPERARAVGARVGPEDVQGAVLEWPQDLPPLPRPAHLWDPVSVEVVGPAARALVEANPYAVARLYRQGEDVYRLRVVPAIPLAEAPAIPMARRGMNQ